MKVLFRFKHVFVVILIYSDAKLLKLLENSKLNTFKNL